MVDPCARRTSFPRAPTGAGYRRKVAEAEGTAPVGRVIGTEDSTPLSFWVALAPDQYLQLDDVVVTDRELPGAEGSVRLSGVVTQVRARQEGARFDSDVFLVADGVLPAETVEAAEVSTTRLEPETFVPPRPGAAVRRAVGEERDHALLFDAMEHKIPIGLGRDGAPLYANVDFIDGTRGAHVNISGVSGVATKTTYATFLLYSLFHSGALRAEAANTKALIFNVKGEDLLFLDHANVRLDAEQEARYRALGLPAGPFESVAIKAPPRRGDPNAGPDTATRARGVSSYFWTIEDFVQDELLPFVFADAEDERQQYTMVIHQVMRRLVGRRGRGRRRAVEGRRRDPAHLPRPGGARGRPPERRRDRDRLGRSRDRLGHDQRVHPPAAVVAAVARRARSAPTSPDGRTG